MVSFCLVLKCFWKTALKFSLNKYVVMITIDLFAFHTVTTFWISSNFAEILISAVEFVPSIYYFEIQIPFLFHNIASIKNLIMSYNSATFFFLYFQVNIMNSCHNSLYQFHLFILSYFIFLRLLVIGFSSFCKEITNIEFYLMFNFLCYMKLFIILQEITNPTYILKYR